MKLNFGCGHNHIDGFVNVDAAPECRPDQVWDLEQIPWPWADNIVSEARFIHSLEHMGGDSKIFLCIMKELYRIMKPDGKIYIEVPHPHHDNFINDPTHVRPITPDMLRLFDRSKNDEMKILGYANSPLAHYTGVNFQLLRSEAILAPPYDGMLDRGEISQNQVAEAARSRLNVVLEYRLTLAAVKS